MATSKKFLNENGANAVAEMLEGLVKLHPEHVCKLNGLDVIVRSDFEAVKQSQVALISGGGSGHEPAHAGLCGAGMLTAAVCGAVFASPSMEAVLHTIRTVTGPKGCLLIVKNYTGDRLNFGLAAEQAKREGFKVDIVFVCDDAALADKGVTGRRGLAGTVLVHKVAGATAATGAGLDEVRGAAQAVANSVRTVGAALSVCNVPGKKLSDRLKADDGMMELGLGIHGEPGRETLPVLSTNELVHRIANIILNDFGSTDGRKPTRVALLLNNLGATTPVEMYGVANALLGILAREPYGLVVERIYAGPVMTSLEMQGVSVSVLAVDTIEMDPAALLSCLDAPASALGWAGALFSYRGGADTARLSVPVAAPDATTKAHQGAARRLSVAQAADLERRVRAAARALVESEPQLTEWDKLAGDGDAGETFEKGAKLVLAVLDQGLVDTTSPQLTMAALAEQARKMGGTSGAVLAIFFTACEAQLSHNADYGKALRTGCDAITRYGGATPGMRTMLDPLDAMARTWTTDSTLAELAAAAKQGADATATMKASAGRANYVPDENLRGVPDPGAKAVEFAMTAFASE